MWKRRREKKMKELKLVSVLLVALLMLSVLSVIQLAPVAQGSPDIHPAPSMWIEPSIIELNTAEHDVGYTFEVVVWANATGYEIAGWQFKMIYNKNYLRAIDCVYTGTDGLISNFFEQSGTASLTPLTPTIDDYYNDTHNYVLHGEAWSPTVPNNPYATGVGSLSKVTFEVVSAPPKGGSIYDLIDIKTECPGATYLTDKDGVKVLTPDNCFNCEYTFTWSVPPSPYLGVYPVSQEFGMWDNVTGWPVDVSVYIYGLSAAWYLVNASFTLSYDSSLVSITADNITIDTATWDVAAEVTVTDGTIDFYVETSQNIGGDVKVADLTFTIIYQGEYPDVDVCPLTFSNIHLYDHTMEIPTETPIDGEIRIVGFIALPMPHLEVSPTEVTIGPEPSVGEEFSVDIVMKNLYAEWKLVGYNFRLSYCPDILEIVDIQEGPFLSTASWGYVVLEDVEIPAAGPPSYVGITKFVLNVTAEYMGEYTFTIEPTEDIRILINGTLTNTFTLSALPAPAWAVYEIELRNYNAYPIIRDYTIKCTPTTYGVEIYDITDPANPVHLDWYRNVAAPPYTYFFTGIEPDGIFGPHVAVGGMLATDTGTWYVFPEGEGVLATITFRVLKQGYENLTCALNLFDIILADKDRKEIPYETPVNGTVTILGFSLPGRQIDVYTQYPAPYGGQGPNNPSDMFTPQQEVILYAKVTYNWWGMENKLVTFHVLNNTGGTYIISPPILTNSEGIAEFHFRMPSYDPDLFGVWTVNATVEIAGVTIYDTLQFHFDTLVEIVDVHTDKYSYAHGDTVEVTVTLHSHAMQPRNVLVAAMITDELGFVVAFGTASLVVEGAEFCTPNEYTVTITLEIPHEAVAGMATVHVGCYDQEPAEGGVALCPEATTEIFIEPY
ncbi:hypothetical protein DRO69_08360 [Candidatus Bathyarchaeota archaeon]|nr:MAG: hypothetical protein DRO69_08360 [Candidatus Bathyarchaeota archaeon]